MNPCLEHNEHIDFHHSAIRKKAAKLATDCCSEEVVTCPCFEFVRNSIKHSWDFKMIPVTYRALGVLLHGAGYCYTKSHLLAALPRANGIPAASATGDFRLVRAERRIVCMDSMPYFCGTMAGTVLMTRQQAGNLRAFSSPVEQLAFRTIVREERDFAEIRPIPLPSVIRALSIHDTVEQVSRNLPDIDVVQLKSPDFPGSLASGY